MCPRVPRDALSASVAAQPGTDWTRGLKLSRASVFFFRMKCKAVLEFDEKGSVSSRKPRVRREPG